MKWLTHWRIRRALARGDALKVQEFVLRRVEKAAGR